MKYIVLLTVILLNACGQREADSNVQNLTASNSLSIASTDELKQKMPDLIAGLSKDAPTVMPTAMYAGGGGLYTNIGGQDTWGETQLVNCSANVPCTEKSVYTGWGFDSPKVVIAEDQASYVKRKIRWALGLAAMPESLNKQYKHTITLSQADVEGNLAQNTQSQKNVLVIQWVSELNANGAKTTSTIYVNEKGDPVGIFTQHDIQGNAGGKSETQFIYRQST